MAIAPLPSFLNQFIAGNVAGFPVGHHLPKALGLIDGDEVVFDQQIGEAACVGIGGLFLLFAAKFDFAAGDQPHVHGKLADLGIKIGSGQQALGKISSLIRCFRHWPLAAKRTSVVKSPVPQRTQRLKSSNIRLLNPLKRRQGTQRCQELIGELAEDRRPYPTLFSPILHRAFPSPILAVQIIGQTPFI